MFKNAGTLVATVLAAILVMMTTLTVKDLELGNSELSGLEYNTIYTVERFETIDGKPTAVVSTFSLKGEKLEIRTMLPDVFAKTEGERFITPSYRRERPDHKFE